MKFGKFRVLIFSFSATLLDQKIIWAKEYISVPKFLNSAERPSNQPLVVEARTVFFDQEKHLLLAKEVSIWQEGRRLRCDQLHYDQAKEELLAQGHVEIIDQAGNRLSCHQARLVGGLKEGIMSQVRALTAEQERVTAQSVKKDQYTQTFLSASYTPCLFCPDALIQQPTWSLHGKEIIHNNQSKIIEFKNVHMKFLGIPVAYVPYFYFPTQRQSGFLAPIISQTKELGAYWGQPYYWAISPNQDLTTALFGMTEGGGMLHSVYRLQTSKGPIRIEGALNGAKTLYIEPSPHLSFTQPQKIGPVRGFGSVDCDLHINPYWRFKIHEVAASDPTFLSTRPFFGQTSVFPYLESETKIEGFFPKQGQYFRCSGLRYQNLSPEDKTQGSCFLYPELLYQYSSPAFWNQLCKTEAQLGTLSLYRPYGGPSMQRLCMNLKWQGSFENTWGQQWNAFLFTNGALYYSQLKPYTSLLLPDDQSLLTPDEVSLLDRPKAHMDRSRGRIFPQAGLEGAWPFFLRNLMLLPRVQLLTSPCGLNSLYIPNQDSQVIEFNDANILWPNRFMGWDRVDDGTRLNYVLETEYRIPGSDLGIQILGGQSYAFSRPAKDLAMVGVRKGFSDTVGRVQLNLGEFSNLIYRCRYQFPTNKSSLQEVGGTVGCSFFRLATTYIFLRPDQGKVADSNQLFWQASWILKKYWTLKAFVTQDFLGKSWKNKILDKGLGVEYQDDCFSAGLVVQHAFFKMRDLVPGFSVNFYVSFKNLGTSIRHQPQRFPRNMPNF